jgi:hypothetical protein
MTNSITEMKKRSDTFPNNKNIPDEFNRIETKLK